LVVYIILLFIYQPRNKWINTWVSLSVGLGLTTSNNYWIGQKILYNVLFLNKYSNRYVVAYLLIVGTIYYS